MVKDNKKKKHNNDNQQDMGKPLIVYKASAGSGKTFTLATEYIKLLVENPMSYRSILAVTFTNKATEEMKQRILSQLYGIWKQLDDSRDYTEAICRQLDVSPAFVSRQAGMALHLLLHHYSYFKVETIDAFFQSVLRNLARELDLTANLKIELNDVQIEEMAVDKMIEGLDTTSPVLDWILKYIYDSISDDKSWNVIGQIKIFGRTIFKDYYKEVAMQLNEKMSDPAFFEAFTKRLREDRTKAKDRMREIAESFFDTIDSEGLGITDFPYGANGIPNFFIKLRNGIFDESIAGKRIIEALDDSNKWAKKSSKDRTRITDLAEGQLMPLLHFAIEERPKQWRKYKSADLTLRHLDQLRLLDSIEKKVREMNEEANRFLLTDTQQILHSLISDNDSPFIFEKIGTQLAHVMIDEFQDTSTVQWANFKVLLKECMSHEQAENLIVGDVKQSIYRWRSGDWRMLNNIRGEFSYPDQQIEVRSLDTNYRSKRRIIDFNNAFFTEAAKIEYAGQAGIDPDMAAQLQSAYADVCQKTPQKRGDEGYVNISMLPAEDYEENTMDRVCDIITTLLDKGVKPGKIAILLRKNKHIPIIAKYLADKLPEVSLVSDEAFRLDASLAVNALILAIRFIAHPDDAIAKATLMKVYQKEILGQDIHDNDLLLHADRFDRLLPEAYIAHLQELKKLPLYELNEQLYSIFQLWRIKNQSAYVCAFYDQVSSFTEDNYSDIDTFLNAWDTRFCSKTIHSDELNGIRLISIHKSKGLEFDNVIIPYCDWTLEHLRDVIWCQPSEEPYNELPLVPIDFSKGEMTGTAYEQDYVKEHFQNVVDNLNLLYVAFTRAGSNLFVIGQKGAKATSRSLLVEQCLPLVAKKLPEAQVSGETDANEDTILEYGEIYVKEEEKNVKHSQNVFLSPVEVVDMEIQTFANKTEFRQSNKSRDFISGDDDESENRNYIKTGSLLHKVFSTIRTAEDIDGALKQLETEGIVYDEQLTADRLSGMLRKRLADKRVADWFSGRWRIFNECTILTKDRQTGQMTERRPDRVMTDGKEMIVVDFKFGRRKDQYLEQVREYMQLLSDMGYDHVRGYLWFVYSNKIEEVTPTNP